MGEHQDDAIFTSWFCPIDQCGFSIEDKNMDELMIGAIEHYKKYHEDEDR